MDLINGKKPSPGRFGYNLDVPYFNYDAESRDFRKPEGLNFKKSPIILFGCSFTYGDGLNVEDTFSYKLSKKAKRPVYNYAMQGWGLQHMYYILNLDKFYKQQPEPSYVIYTLINDHYCRLHKYQFAPPNSYILLRYKYTDGKFKQIYPHFRPLWGLYSVNLIQNYINDKYTFSNINYEKNLNEYYLMLKESKKLLNQHYKNTKFVIFIYRDNNDFKYMFTDNDKFMAKLHDDGFIVIDSAQLLPNIDLKSSAYITIDNCHPSGKAWDLIVPAIVKTLNL